MDISTVKDALGLDAASSDQEVLGKIAQLRAGAGEEVGDPPDLRLIRAGQHEQVALNADGSVSVTLLYPITKGKETWTEFTFRRPKLKDLRVANKAGEDPLTVAAALMCALSGQAQTLIDDLDAADAEVCGVVCRFLQQARPRTGPK